MARISMLSPWMTFYHQVVAFFAHDQEIKVIWDDTGEDFDQIKIYVNNPNKAEALYNLIPHEKTFGNKTIFVSVIPSNEPVLFKTVKKLTSTSSNDELYCAALANNDALSFVRTVKELYNNPLTYIVFKKEVVQYFNDSLGDYYGQKSTLYEDIARDLFEEKEGVFFCTDKVVKNIVTHTINPYTISSSSYTVST